MKIMTSWRWNMLLHMIQPKHFPNKLFILKCLWAQWCSWQSNYGYPLVIFSSFHCFLSFYPSRYLGNEDPVSLPQCLTHTGIEWRKLSGTLVTSQHGCWIWVPTTTQWPRPIFQPYSLTFIFENLRYWGSSISGHTTILMQILVWSFPQWPHPFSSPIPFWKVEIV